jgi:hypothetical protein
MTKYMMWDGNGNFVNWFDSAAECMAYAEKHMLLKFRIDHKEYSNG